MPDTFFSSGSVFDTHRGRLGGWLRSNMDHVIALTQEEISNYSHKDIVSGWSVTRNAETGRQYKFYILLSRTFPYAKVGIAYIDDDHYLQWPHVEEDGYLCLKTGGWLPIENLEYSIRNSIDEAVELIESCQSEEFILLESSREFVPYWNRAADSQKGFHIISLIDLRNKNTRQVSRCITHGKHLIGETEEQLQNWMQNAGWKHEGEFRQAIFGYLDEPPFMPMPKTAKQLVERIIDQCSHIDHPIKQLNLLRDTVFVFAAENEDGIGLIGAKVDKLNENGFQRNLGELAKARWKLFGTSKLFKVTRIDSSWVHGRDHDTGHSSLSASRVVILGAGSLGSQVASRLAQAGVGQLTIADPEVLASCNIGRHALGMESLERSKSEMLASTLSRKYPHAIINGFKKSWQLLMEEQPEMFVGADLIVSCIGEVDADLAWDDWYSNSGLSVPAVYGWLGTQGTTGHAVAVTANDPGMSCLLDEDGLLRNPDTHFKDGTMLKAEPGCGTLFQPYGPLSVGHVELLVARLCIDILTSKATSPEHRIVACSTEDLTELGGTWTHEHEAKRPAGYTGSFEYKRAVIQCGNCYQCRTK